jgi:hypothetical protein
MSTDKSRDYGLAWPAFESANRRLVSQAPSDKGVGTPHGPELSSWVGPTAPEIRELAPWDDHTGRSGGMSTSSLRTDTLGPPAGEAAPSTSSALAIGRAGLWILFAAHVVTGWGTQWDIQWHLRIGRDSFWIAPHVITYSGVTAIVLVSFGVLAWTTARALGGADGGPGTVRVLGFTGTPGYHLAAWGIGLTVLAAPIDDLWHRLFGLDVTLWSPPHLLGLLGGIINAAACWLIARETYSAGSRARVVAIVLAGALVYGGISIGLQPSIRIAYTYGGIRFFTYPILEALLAPLALVATARLSRLRVAPVVALLVVLLTGVVALLSRARALRGSSPCRSSRRRSRRIRPRLSR